MNSVINRQSFHFLRQDSHFSGWTSYHDKTTNTFFVFRICEFAVVVTIKKIFPCSCLVSKLKTLCSCQKKNRSSIHDKEQPAKSLIIT